MPKQEVLLKSLPKRMKNQKKRCSSCKSNLKQIREKWLKWKSPGSKSFRNKEPEKLKRRKREIKKQQP